MCRRNGRCCPPRARQPRPSAQAAATAARERCKTPAGVWSYIQRMGDAEGVVGELKRQHGMDRARSRGTPLFHVQLLLGCSALNLKRIARTPVRLPAAPPPGHEPRKRKRWRPSGEASTRSTGVSWHRITLTAGAGAANTHLAPAWTIGLSLN